MAATKHPLRIAVLNCFTIPSHISATRGQFHEIFDAWIQKAVEGWNVKQTPPGQLEVVVRGHEVVTACDYPEPSNIDGVIVTGSTASAYDDEEWIKDLQRYIQDLYRSHPRVKIFGGCFGHQLVSQALLGGHGVRVEKNPKGWEIGVHNIDVAPKFAAQFPGLLNERQLSFQFLHADHVVLGPRGMPATWIQLGNTELCEVHGLLNPGRVLTFQGHPEFDDFINMQSTKSLADSGKFSSDEFQHYAELIEQDDRRVLAGELLIEFLQSQPA